LYKIFLLLFILTATQLYAETASSETRAPSFFRFKNMTHSEKRAVRITRIALGSLAVGFFSAGLAYNSQSSTYYDEYESLPIESGSEYEEAWKKVESAEAKRDLFYTLSAVTGFGLSITFLF
jgi:hypothetical protein